jgi:hypothetical protein
MNGHWNGTFSTILTRRSRRGAVLAAYGGYLTMTGIWYLARRVDSLALWLLVIPLALVLMTGLAVLLTSSVWHAANEPDPHLDERQQRVRDRAYLQSYRLLASLTSLAVLYGGLAWDNAWWLPSTWNQVQALVWGVLLLTLTLPAAVVAWTEPDPPAEI